ncbi:MAG: hypothetical protein AAB011_13040 [Candidatus Eisenbacteria bacterium]
MKLHLPPSISTLLLYALVAIIPGCAAEHQSTPAADGLTADMLRSEGVALVGVTVVDEVEQIRPPLVEAMERSLQYWRPDIAVASAGRVRDQLGLPAYRRILAGFQQSGALTEPDREALSSALQNVARYLILARVEMDAMKVRGRGTFRSSNVTGTIGSIGVGVSSRNTKVRVILYDAAVGRTRRSAVYTGSSDFTPPAGMPAGRPRPDIVLGQRHEPEPHFDPAPHLPTLVDALLEVFQAFAQDLPGPVLPPADFPDSSAVRGFRVSPEPILTLPR